MYITAYQTCDTCLNIAWNMYFTVVLNQSYRMFTKKSVSKIPTLQGYMEHFDRRASVVMLQILRLGLIFQDNTQLSYRYSSYLVYTGWQWLVISSYWGEPAFSNLSVRELLKNHHSLKWPFIINIGWSCRDE